jgi:hypothetical protein
MTRLPGAERSEGAHSLSCRRCDRPVRLARRALDEGLRLCEECMPRFQLALSAWQARTAGARADGE